MSKVYFTEEAGLALWEDASANAKDIEAAVAAHIQQHETRVEQLQLSFEADKHQLTVKGHANDNYARERALLCAGNIRGIACVDDQIDVDDDAKSGFDWHTVQPGDTLQSMARFYLRDYQKYTMIAAANAPVLSNPDHVDVGLKLLIPPEPRRCNEATPVRRKSVLPLMQATK